MLINKRTALPNVYLDLMSLVVMMADLFDHDNILSLINLECIKIDSNNLMKITVNLKSFNFTL